MSERINAYAPPPLCRPKSSYSSDGCTLNRNPLARTILEGGRSVSWSVSNGSCCLSRRIDVFRGLPKTEINAMRIKPIIIYVKTQVHSTKMRSSK